MILRRAIFVAIAWVCLTGAMLAQTLTFPALTGRVVDEAGVLSPDDRAALTESLAELEAKTTDQLVVVTLKSLQGDAIEDYGYKLGRAWRIGQKDRDSGVLLIVAPAEHQVRIEVGYGLEGTLTDAATKVIIETAILPAFKTGDLAGGIKRGTYQIIQMLVGDTANPPPAAIRNGAPAKPVWPAVIAGLFGVGLLIFCAITRGAVCRGIMQILFLLMLSGRGGSSRGGGGGSSFSGGGGSFGGGGSSGSW